MSKLITLSGFSRITRAAAESRLLCYESIKTYRPSSGRKTGSSLRAPMISMSFVRPVRLLALSLTSGFMSSPGLTTVSISAPLQTFESQSRPVLCSLGTLAVLTASSRKYSLPHDEQTSMFMFPYNSVRIEGSMPLLR